MVVANMFRSFILITFLFSVSFHICAKNLEVLKKELNFGVVVNNSNYTIYRSAKLGAKGLKTLYRSLKELNLPIPKTIIYMNDEGYKKGLLDYITTKGNPLFSLEQYNLSDVYGFKYYHSFLYEERTYLDGYSPMFPREDIDLENKLGSLAVDLFGPNPNDGPDRDLEDFYFILDLILDPSHGPVLFHCLGGMHRTGIMGLALRYLQGEQWVKNSLGRGENKAQKEYRKYNRFIPRKENFNFINTISNTERFKSYISEYQEKLNL